VTNNTFGKLLTHLMSIYRILKGKGVLKSFWDIPILSTGKWLGVISPIDDVYIGCDFSHEKKVCHLYPMNTMIYNQLIISRDVVRF
jgi:hypothetical protein